MADDVARESSKTTDYSGCQCTWAEFEPLKDRGSGRRFTARVKRVIIAPRHFLSSSFLTSKSVDKRGPSPFIFSSGSFRRPDRISIAVSSFNERDVRRSNDSLGRSSLGFDGWLRVRCRLTCSSVCSLRLRLFPIPSSHHQCSACRLSCLVCLSVDDRQVPVPELEVRSGPDGGRRIRTVSPARRHIS